MKIELTLKICVEDAYSLHVFVKITITISADDEYTLRISNWKQ